MAVSPFVLDVYRDALASDEPLWTLRGTVILELERNGGDKQRVLSDLDKLRVVLRDEGRDDDEDIVTEVMSHLLGWSTPKMKI